MESNAMTLSMKKLNSGFSLTEMMVAMVIGLIVLAGVSSVMVSNKKSYTAQDSLARLQENARTAMMILSYDLRNVGYMGCNTDRQNWKSVLKTAASGASPVFSIDPLLEGSTAGGNWLPSNMGLGQLLSATPKANTDLIMIRGLDTSQPFGLLRPMNQQSASMQIVEDSGIQDGEILAITDCDSTDIFQATNVNKAGGFDNLIHNTGGSTSPGNRKVGNPPGAKLNKSYGTDAKLMRFKSNIYYIAPSQSGSGEPALFRQALVSSSSNSSPQQQELVEGIENLQVLYGVDQNGDRMPDTYVKSNLIAGSSWNNVVSVRFGIIARALANLQTTDLKTAATVGQLDTKDLDIDGDGVIDFDHTDNSLSTTSASGKTVDDRQYQRRMFRTTILFRNLQ